MKRIILTLLTALCTIYNATAQPGDAKWITTGQHTGTSLPLFRKTFDINKKKPQVTFYATALGIYDVYVNNRAVSRHELKPGWTDYRKEVTYQTIDISPAIRQGRNEITVQLSNGWWAGAISRGVYGKDTPLCLMARIAAGDRTVAVTDTTWQYSTDGPLLAGDIYNGEHYDARRKATEWHSATVTTAPQMAVIPFEGPEVRIRPERLWRHPQTITIYKDTIATGTDYGMIKPERTIGNRPFTLHKGETAVVDLGQNMVGWMAVNAKGAKGTVLTLRHGEMLNYNGDHSGRLDDGPGGSVWLYNLRTADATLRYVFNGDRKGEQYHPHHTFMGFRYVSVSATDDVEIRSLTGQVVGSEITERGEFECSDPSINQLYSNIRWGQRGNFLSIPTDCPQRDERLGWTGDTQIFSRTALYQSDAAAFYRKWMRDMHNSQRSDGAYPDIAPYPNFWGFGTAAWGDAGVIVPWTVYDMTGDTAILEENYGSMTAYMQWLERQQETTDSVTYTHIGAGTATGDWLAYDPLDARYVAVAYYAHVAQLMDSIATVTGRHADAMHYRQLYEDIRSEFRQRYINPDGSLSKTTQTAYLLALRYGLLPEEHRAAARDSLRRSIESNGYRLSTGFVGTGILCTTLSDEGMDDLAYALLLQRKNPSWLYSVDQGATTVWERWDSYTLDGGYHKHHWNMNSFNHYAYGAVAEWMYAYIGGIKPDAAGFRTVILAPHADRRADNHPTLATQPRMTWARTKVHTPHGDITSAWRMADDRHYEYTFSLPAAIGYRVAIPDLQPTDKVIIKRR